jgi:hypothetical protein
MKRTTTFHPRRNILKFLLLSVASSFGLSAAANGKGKELAADQGQETSFTFDGSAKSTGWLDFDMPDNRHIVLAAELNGVSVEILLDSGVGGLVLDKEISDKLGLKARHAFTGIGVTGTAQGAVAQGVIIALGNLTVRAPQTTIFDLSRISAVAGRPIVAIVGRDLLGPLIVDIDFPHKRLAFHDGRDGLEPQGGTTVPLTRGSFSLREIPIAIEGHDPIQAIFDLGSDTPIYLSPAYVARVDLLSGKRTSTSLSAGVEGTQENEVAVVEKVKIGDTLLYAVPIEVPQKWEQQAFAFVGLPVFRRFRLIIDYGHDRLTIVPDRDTVSEAFRKDRSGIGAIPSDNHLTITHIAAGSPAEAAGLRVGDEITAINGRKIDAEYIRSKPREGSKPAGTKFNLTLKDGKDVSFVLADYF